MIKPEKGMAGVKAQSDVSFVVVLCDVSLKSVSLFDPPFESIRVAIKNETLLKKPPRELIPNSGQTEKCTFGF